MSILPQTVCRRCHRKYSALRPRCPYCRYKNEKEVRRPVPESDSAVKGSDAAHRAGETRSWQMLVGGILIICVVVAMIAVISVGVNSRTEDSADAAERQGSLPDVDVETTPVPVPTPSPSPSPTPAPTVTSVQITYMGVDKEDFQEPAGSQVQLEANWYPATVEATVVWSSSDDSIATVDENGLVTVVSSTGTCEIYATVGGVSDTCVVYTR